jgi:predicted metal-dependent hydrolase
MLVTVSEPEVVRIGDLDIRVSFSDRRRSVRLTVERDATVSAVLPTEADRADLIRLVQSKRRWVYSKLAERQALGEPRAPRKYVSGEGFFYLGRSYRLLLVDEAPAPVRLIRGRLELRRDHVPDATRQLVWWYRRVGRSWLGRRLQPWAARMEASVAELRVLPLGFRWGSCSPDARLNIHWATMQLPPDLVDYVLAHELGHVHRPDHGPEFWRIVERAMPDCQARRGRLLRLGPELWLPGRP